MHEVTGFKVIAVQNLGKHVFIGGVTETMQSFDMFRSICKWLKIRMFHIFPAGFERLCHSPAAFGETSVTKFSFKGKDLPPGSIHGLSDGTAGGTCKSLISLAMVIGTHVEIFMVLMVIPFDIFHNISVPSFGRRTASA